MVPLDGKDWEVIGFDPHELRLVLSRAGQKVDIDDKHSDTGWVPATVPGCTHDDLLRAVLIKNPYVALNQRDCEWVMRRDWVYRKRFHVPAAYCGKRNVHLRFSGLDYSGEVYLNGKRLGAFEGTFMPVAFDVSAALDRTSENVLLVRFDKPPENEPQAGDSAKARKFKPRFNYGWDFSTCLVPVGIWDRVDLVCCGELVIDDVRITADVINDDGLITVDCTVTARKPAKAALELSVYFKGRKIFTAVEKQKLRQGGNHIVIKRPVSRPRLWYPNQCGNQPLYTLKATIRDRHGVSGSCETVFGFRTMKFIRNAGAPSRSLPYTCVVNGEKIFLKGWNWVPLDLMYGRVTDETYCWFLRLMKESGANLVRVWGGGLIEKDVFYRLCDEYGIMIWQEFPLSSSSIAHVPPRDKSYLAALKEVAVSAVMRKRNHPSLIIWCGGNELATQTRTGERKPLACRHPALKALKETVETLDPGRCFLPSSPSGPSFFWSEQKVGRGLHHDVHGPWHFRVPEHYAYYNRFDGLLHSEFGASGYSSMETLQKISSGASVWPSDERNAVFRRHGTMYVQSDLIRNVFEVFGRINNPDKFVFASQFLQAEGLRYAIESHRRRKFKCSGVIPWQFNEPWPNASCTNVIEHCGRPKMAYYYASRAYASRHVSLSYDRICWKEGRCFNPVLFYHNSTEKSGACRVECTVGNLDGVELGRWQFDMVFKKNSCGIAQQLNWTVPHIDQHVFLVVLRLFVDTGQAPVSENTYVFSTKERAPLAPLLGLKRADLNLTSTMADGKHLVEVCNISAVPAFFVYLFADGNA
ncbi:MAG: hypothetical protein L6437_04230, partial [Kiritimatiellae bacterium]|nr:hypothetical protein [Kiritimatiellia bacterium]